LLHIWGKIDKVRWIAQGPTYQNHLVCLKSSGAPDGGHFKKWPPSASASNMYYDISWVMS